VSVQVVVREVWWWLILPFRLAWGHPLRVGLLVIAAAVLHAAGQHAYSLGLAVAVPFLVISLRVWWWISPSSFERMIGEPRRRRQIMRQVRIVWPQLVQRAGLSFVGLATKPDGDPLRQTPRLRSARWANGQLELTPTVLVGQEISTWENAAETIRVAAGASRIHLRADVSRTALVLVLGFGDPLTRPIAADVPGLDAPVGDVRRVVLGQTEDGHPFSLALGVHTLVAGATGSGKASAVHGLLIGLAPAVTAGVVEVHGVDLKGGMELGMAARLLTRCATTPVEAVVVLEDAAVGMAARARRLAGHVRTHTISTTDPLVVVLIDELAAITAYLTDRDLKNPGRSCLVAAALTGPGGGLHGGGVSAGSAQGSDPDARPVPADPGVAAAGCDRDRHDPRRRGPTCRGALRTHPRGTARGGLAGPRHRWTGDPVPPRARHRRRHHHRQQPLPRDTTDPDRDPGADSAGSRPCPHNDGGGRSGG